MGITRKIESSIDGDIMGGDDTIIEIMPWDWINRSGKTVKEGTHYKNGHYKGKMPCGKELIGHPSKAVSLWLC